MSKDQLIENAVRLYTKYWSTKDLATVCQVELLFDEYLRLYPDDTSVLLQCAVFVDYAPIADYIKSIELLDRVLEIDPNNAYALIIRAYIEDVEAGAMNETIFQRLLSFKIDSLEVKAMIQSLCAQYYLRTSSVLYEKYLLNSIKLDPYQVLSYTCLAEMFIREGKIKQGQQYAKAAVSNVVHVYDKSDDWIKINLLENVNSFINEKCKGTHVSRPYYTWLEDMTTRTSYADIEAIERKFLHE